MVPGPASLVSVATVVAQATPRPDGGPHLDVVTDALGLVTLLIAGTSAVAVLSTDLSDEVGDSAPMLIVLGSLLVGGIVGSLLRLESRIEGLGGWLQHRLSGEKGSAERARFVEGFVISSLVFCSGPLTILGSLNDGLGNGPDQILLKSALDGFAAIAFAASFGWGVAASVVTIVVVQGGLTLAGVALGDVLPDAHLAAITAVVGCLVGICGCSASARSRSPTCSPHWWWHRCSSRSRRPSTAESGPDELLVPVGLEGATVVRQGTAAIAASTASWRTRLDSGELGHARLRQRERRAEQQTDGRVLAARLADRTRKGRRRAACAGHRGRCRHGRAPRRRRRRSAAAPSVGPRRPPSSRSRNAAFADGVRCR